MEASLLRSVLQSVESVRNLVRGDQELHVRLMNGLDAIKCELALLSAEVMKTLAENNQGAKPPEWILQLQDLAYDIEDFLDERGRDPKSSAPVRLVQAAMVTDPRPIHLQYIDDFKKRIKSIRSFRGGGTSVAAPRSAFPSPNNNAPAPPVLQQAQPVGMEQPKRDLTKLLLAAGADGGGGGGHENELKLKVISIVGCSGVGKTTLARQLYDDSTVGGRFPHRAWVEATDSLNDVAGARRLLHCVLHQVGGPQEAEDTTESGQDGVVRLTRKLQNFLHDKRYLVVIDGVRQNDAYWGVIGAALPKKDKGSRVVVTTNIRSVATGCSSAGSYLYCMRGLGQTHSEELFWAKLGRDQDDRPPALADGLQTFFQKCDGLPLLLVDTAEFLRRQGTALTDEHCRVLGDDLRKHLAYSEDQAFGRTRTSLVQCYDSLPDYQHKVCMLSVSAFPKGHRINRKSLIRRWIAEGLVVDDAQHKVACQYLDKLRDLSIIEPHGSGSGSVSYTNKMKRCQVHGAMLEFLVQQSVSWNFITLNKEHEVVRNHEAGCSARRLSVHGAAGEIDRRQIDLSRIRSLTVCDTTTSNCHMRLETCKLLRVLDLESCSWLSDDHLGVICGLLYLKYLSLRHTQVSELPNAIKDLHCLETLDVRQTKVTKLPLQVLKLPQLIHLFGKFELPRQLGDDDANNKKLERFFSVESKLQTLSGFKIVNDRGFKLLLLHLKLLRKVKIWCEVPVPPPSHPAASWQRIIRKMLRNRRENRISVDNLSDHLVEPLKERFVGSNAIDSLSVDFGGHCSDFLASVLNDKYAFSSLKVCGKMEGLPESSALRSVRHIKELHLCNTGLPIVDLSRLQSLPCLVYLKLVENTTDFWNGKFVVEEGGFPSLQQLCFDGHRLPEVKFGSTTVSPLLSLQLICPEPPNKDLGVKGIKYLRHLNEVILHPGTSPAKMDAWKLKADKHTNRPYVKRQQQAL